MAPWHARVRCPAGSHPPCRRLRIQRADSQEDFPFDDHDGANDDLDGANDDLDGSAEFGFTHYDDSSRRQVLCKFQGFIDRTRHQLRHCSYPDL